jgi:PilZ domain
VFLIPVDAKPNAAALESPSEYPAKFQLHGLKSGPTIQTIWRPAMAQPQPEKRNTRRFSLDLPISIKFLDNGRQELAGHTRDVSSRGVFMYLDTEITADAPIEFVMTLPAEITLSDPIRVRCTGKILRVDKAVHEQGVAVAIDKYDFLGEE